MSSGLPLSYPVYLSSCTIGILVCICRCHGHCLRYCWDSFLRHHTLVVVIVVAVKVTVVDVVVIVVVLVAVVVVKVVCVVSIVAKNRSCQDNRDRVCHTLAQFPDLQKCRFFNSKARTVSVNHKERFYESFCWAIWSNMTQNYSAMEVKLWSKANSTIYFKYQSHNHQQR